MRFVVVIGAILLAIVVVIGVQNRTPARQPQPPAPRTNKVAIVGLPNGATLAVGPNSPGAQIVAFMASDEPGPRRFEPGGREFDDWSHEPTPESQARLGSFAQLRPECDRVCKPSSVVLLSEA
jgi:hypothetical protein